MNLKVLLTRELTRNLRLQSFFTRRSYAISSEAAKMEDVDLTSVDSKPQFDDEMTIDEQTLQEMRNKSKLSSEHHNILNDRRPYETPGIAHHHDTLKFKRRMLGRYGLEGSGVPPGVAWPTKEDILELKERERVTYPRTIQESWADIAAAHKADEERTRAREDDIAAKLAKTGQWEREMRARMAKKEAEVKAVRERKERLVEEVRRHFGFKVDPRDEKFKEMLELKEKEDKKRRKDAKKKERAEKIMEKLLVGQPKNKDASLKFEPIAQGKPITPTDPS